VPVLRPITHPAGLRDDDEPEHREYPVQAAEGEAKEGSAKSGRREAEGGKRKSKEKAERETMAGVGRT